MRPARRSTTTTRPTRPPGGHVAGRGPRFNTAYNGNGDLLALPGPALFYNAKHEDAALFTRDDGLTADYRYESPSATA